MKMICLSDTHGLYKRIKIPECDVMIVAGDATQHGSEKEIQDFGEWARAQPCKRSIIVPGNHDHSLIGKSNPSIPGSTILSDSGCRINGINLWGFPWGLNSSPLRPSHNKALLPLSEYQHKCRMIPNGVDILVGHSRVLPEEISHTRPMIHVFGHKPYLFDRSPLNAKRGRPVRVGDKYGRESGPKWIYASVSSSGTNGLHINRGPIMVLVNDNHVVDARQIPLSDVLSDVSCVEIDDDMEDLEDEVLQMDLGYMVPIKTDFLIKQAAQKAGISERNWVRHRIREIAIAELSKRRPDIPPVE